MDSRVERTPRRFLVNCLKVIGFIVWAILPLQFSFLLNLTQEITPIPVRWVLAGLWVAFTLFSIRWIWRYYLRLYPDPLPKMRGKDIGIALGLFVFLRIVAVVGTSLNSAIYGNALTSNDAALQEGNPLAVFYVYFFLFNFTIGIFAPILEELAFRGIFLNLMFSPKAKWLPGIITSAVFSFLHGMDNIITFSMYFIMGLTFFYAYRRRGTIKDAILLHILNNILAMILSIILYLNYHLTL